MKKNDLENKVLMIGYTILLVIVLVTCWAIFRKTSGPVDSSSSTTEITEVIDTTSLDVSTETTESSTTEETSTSTQDETSTTVEETTESLTQEQTTETSTVSTKASSSVTTESSTEISTTTTMIITTTIPQLKTIEQVAREVWQGLWGAGEDRKIRLESAGYNYEEVQKMVCELRDQFVTTTAQQSTPIPTTITSTDTSYDTNKEFVKTFSRGTYYAYGGARNGGSGRSLIDCSIGDGTVKGSIASSYLYRNYGYNYNGKRTMVYLEIKGYPSMNGYYYLDDSDAGNPNVIDFFYLRNSNCQFQYQGVVQVDCYIVK